MSFASHAHQPNDSSEFSHRWFVSPYVRVVQNNDGAILLDIQQGMCFSMNSVGIEIWRSLERNPSFAHVQEALRANYPDVPRERIEADISELVQQLQTHELITQKPARSLAPSTAVIRLVQRKKSATAHTTVDAPKPRFVFVKAILALCVYDLFGFGKEFCKIFELVRSWKVSQTAAATDTCELVCRGVNHACVWYPKRVLCLQRSAVTTCLLRESGVPAKMVVGAQKFPFKAHAWTEVNGHPVNERRDVQHLYLIWERC